MATLDTLASADLFCGQLIRLAAPILEDRDVLARWSNDAEYLRLLDDDPVGPRSADSFQFPSPSGTAYYFHVRLLSDDTLIGFVVLHAVKPSNQSALLAIGIGERAYRGKGYGTDTMRTILNYGFRELNLNRIGLTVMAYNGQAIHVYEKVGFVREGASREAICRDGQRFDLIHMGILRAEWVRWGSAQAQSSTQ